ncbi:hypothetical protein ACNVD4_17880, partial [Rhizobium sp. BR5]
MLKLASPVWSPVSSRHFVSLPIIRPPRKCFGDFRSGIGQIRRVKRNECEGHRYTSVDVAESSIPAACLYDFLLA